jgi:hypothetical protein
LTVAKPSQAVEHAVGVEKDGSYVIARVESINEHGLFHTIRTQIDLKPAEQIRGPEGNERSFGVNGDDGSEDQVFRAGSTLRA